MAQEAATVIGMKILIITDGHVKDPNHNIMCSGNF